MEEIKKKTVSDPDVCGHDCENCEEPCEECENEEPIILTGDDGREVAFYWLDTVEYGEDSYGVFAPADDGEDDGDVVILRITDEDDSDEVEFDVVDDDELVEKIFELFKENNADRFLFKD